ncbi:hypothetical protein KKG48_01500 [Patescibacteria group bacterium]|nr:hypothetical protein [Patescibacteria group bacterium]MCG2694574.1 hypothetical protein [Candidatus Parcubacteria bacterium]
MSKNVSGADNQQGSPLFTQCVNDDPSETTCRAPSRKEIQAYLQGALHDASLNKRKRYRFTQKGNEWLLVIKNLFVLLNCNAWIYREGKTRDVYALETLADFLDFGFDPLSLKTNREKSAYIRGFFDAEGGIPNKNLNKFYIQLVQKDKLKIKKLKKILDELGISTGKIHNPSVRVDPNYWRVFVSAKSHLLFAKKIWSWHPRKQKIFRRRMEI